MKDKHRYLGVCISEFYKPLHQSTEELNRVKIHHVR